MLKTEQRNEKTTHIDKMDTLSMLKIINEENMNSVRAVEAELDNIAKAVDSATECFQKGGRMFYIGAGTSGRIAIMDAAECPPTYGVDYDKVVGIIAGGEKCLVRAGEGGEDVKEAGVADMQSMKLPQTISLWVFRWQVVRRTFYRLLSTQNRKARKR